MRKLHLLLALVAACGGEPRQAPDGGPADAGGVAGGPCLAAGAAGAADLPDEATLESRIALGAGVVQDVRVEVTIVHPYPRDLDIALVSPAGTLVKLSSDRAGGYASTVFTDSAATAIVDGSGPLAGEYRPEEPLGRLRGEPTAGTWSLRVSDDSRGDIGRLEGWSLQIADCPPPPCAGGTLAFPIPGSGALPAYLLADATALGSATVVGARVTVWVRDTFDADVNMSLVSPSGTAVELSTGNGGAGDNYEGTHFDDSADLAVSEGAAPFEGSFRPEQPLAMLTGEPAAGRFTIKVLDVGADEDYPQPSVDAASLELDLCELACPAGARAVVASGPGSLHIGAAGSIVDAAVRVSAEAGPITLSGPAEVLLAARPGPFFDSYFADGEGAPLGEGSAPFSGHFQPETPLSALVGQAAAGDYRVSGASALSVYLCVE